MNKHKITPEQIRFYLSATADYVEAVGMQGVIKNGPEGQFDFIMDAASKSKNDEIRIGLPRTLMYIGLRQFSNDLTESVLQNGAPFRTIIIEEPADESENETKH